MNAKSYHRRDSPAPCRGSRWLSASQIPGGAMADMQACELTAQAPASQEVIGMNFCTKCGRPLGSAQNFCPGCRAPLPDTANGVPPSTATSSQPAAPSHAATHASLGGNQQATEGASAPAPHAGPAATMRLFSNRIAP